MKKIRYTTPWLWQKNKIAILFLFPFTFVIDCYIFIFKIIFLAIQSTRPKIQSTPTYHNIQQPTSETFIAKHYDAMDGHEFERFCAKVLEANGFCNVEVTKGSGDYGIDILAEKDGITYAIQCKCYSSNIGNDAVQQAYSGKDFYKRHIGVVLTNKYFTPAAKETAQRNGILLWDREQLDKFIQIAGLEQELLEIK